MRKKQHISKTVFKNIFRDHWSDFKKKCSIYNTFYYDKVIEKMLNCGDLDKMGYAKYLCLGCGESHKVAMTCKSSFCLSCSIPYTDRWVDFIGRRLISGARYRHYGGKGIAKYLAKYLVSPPISMLKTINYDGINFSYWYHDHQTKAIKHETIPVFKFIGRMVQHILPKGFQRIRCYGFHSNVKSAKMRKVMLQILPTQENPSLDSYYVLPRKKFKELYWQSYGKNQLLCPSCGEEMKLECIWHLAYGIISDMMHSDNLYSDTG